MHPIFNFNNDKLLIRALTHCSFANENIGEKDNEQLEFLGDSILNFISGEYLYKKFLKSEMKEGEMTRIRATLVDEKQLSKPNNYKYPAMIKTLDQFKVEVKPGQF